MNRINPYECFSSGFNNKTALLRLRKTDAAFVSPLKRIRTNQMSLLNEFRFSRTRFSFVRTRSDQIHHEMLFFFQLEISPNGHFLPSDRHRNRHLVWTTSRHAINWMNCRRRSLLWTTWSSHFDRERNSPCSRRSPTSNSTIMTGMPPIMVVNHPRPTSKATTVILKNH